jgi:hypothetical protein
MDPRFSLHCCRHRSVMIVQAIDLHRKMAARNLGTKKSKLARVDVPWIFGRFST